MLPKDVIRLGGADEIRWGEVTHYDCPPDTATFVPLLARRGKEEKVVATWELAGVWPPGQACYMATLAMLERVKKHGPRDVDLLPEAIAFHFGSQT